MASPEAKSRMLEREARRLRIIAASVASDEELERFEATRTQPTYGDPEMGRIFSDRAVADLLQSSLGVEIEEDDLSEEGQIYKYNHLTGESEPYYKGSAESAGQPLSDEPVPGDEVEVNDEDVEDSYGETDVIPGSRDASEIRATPAAKAKADQLGIDLNTVSGTGAGGRITSGDVEHAAQPEESEESDIDSEDNPEDEEA